MFQTLKLSKKRRRFGNILAFYRNSYEIIAFFLRDNRASETRARVDYSSSTKRKVFTIF